VRSAFHLFDVLKRYFDTYDRCSIVVEPVSLLEVKETRAYPLPATKIDQSTTSGNIQILETIMQKTLKGHCVRGPVDGVEGIIFAGIACR
ncbi:hypothetical protein BGZ75_001193, partial [Mortierella antarctica]